MLQPACGVLSTLLFATVVLFTRAPLFAEPLSHPLSVKTPPVNVFFMAGSLSPSFLPALPPPPLFLSLSLSFLRSPSLPPSLSPSSCFTRIYSLSLPFRSLSLPPSFPFTSHYYYSLSPSLPLIPPFMYSFLLFSSRESNDHTNYGVTKTHALIQNVIYLLLSTLSASDILLSPALRSSRFVSCWR